MRWAITGLLFALPAALLALLLLRCPASTDEKQDESDKPKERTVNRLAKETSPYLLQHAHNPVNWYPWGEEAFAKAKKEGKLVFLSIGYSSCHWCHVMEKESFANEEVAKILNKHFVCIKVDREERPDIDNVYMTALQVLGQRGGWPLSMFLTPDGKPIVGGTYWPREDRVIGGEKVRGFKTVLKAMIDAYKDQKKEVHEHADELAKLTARELEGVARGLALVKLERKLVTDAVEEVLAGFDREHGGFGRAPKFPTPPRLFLLHDEAVRTKSKEAAQALGRTLDRMARGGIYDQLGGGFHRYSTDRTWTIPHFEKMLYDNAQLAEIYALEFKRTKDPQYERIVRETLAFVKREMTSPEGAFYSALDADSEGEEGRFYVWTDKDLAAALPDKADREFVARVYGTDKGYNFEEKYHALTLPRPLPEVAKEMKLSAEEFGKRLSAVKAKLMAARSKRERPFLDTKVLTSWNGQMIAGYAVAGQALQDKDYLAAAARAADFILKKLRTKEGRLLRTYGAAPGQKAEARLNGYLDDYAYFVHGLLRLHDATGEKKWLDEAKALTDTMIKLHADEKVGGFFYTSDDHEKLFARSKDQYDGAQPSGNSLAALNLVRLSAKTGEKKYRAQAEKTFKALSLPLKTTPSGVTALVAALALYLDTEKPE